MINDIYAYVAVDPETNAEGIVAFYSNGQYSPLVTSDLEQAKKLKVIAHDVAESNKVPVKLVAFQRKRVIDTVSPPIVVAG